MSFSGMKIIVILFAVCIMRLTRTENIRKTHSYHQISRPKGDPTTETSLPHVSQPNGHSQDYTVSNNVTLLYVVGVEGVGHHAVSPALATIGRSCRGVFIEYEGRFFRDTTHYHTTRIDPHIERYMKRWRSSYFVNNSNVFILEDQSFPTGSWLRNSTLEQKKSAASYNLEWMHDHAQRAGVQMKFLHLTRDFYRTVASHVEFDKTFEAHADVLHSFLEHIHAEHAAIHAKLPGIWRQMHYEWFTELRNCTALVSAFIDFAGWDNCDVDFVCEVLQKTMHPATARAVNTTQLAYAQRLPVIQNHIPDLDVSAERTYNFSQWVSPRETSKFVRRVTSASGVDRCENVLARSLETRLSVASTVSTGGTDATRHRPRLIGKG